MDYEGIPQRGEQWQESHELVVRRKVSIVDVAIDRND